MTKLLPKRKGFEGLQPKFLTNGQFHLSIKGGYVDNVFIPEMLVRYYDLKHGDWCDLYGLPSKLVIQKTTAPLAPLTLRPSKFKDIKNCQIERDDSGKLVCYRTTDGTLLADLFALAEFPSLESLPFTLAPNDVIDIRYSVYDQTPRPHVTWVYYNSEPDLNHSDQPAGLDYKRSNG